MGKKTEVLWEEGDWSIHKLEGGHYESLIVHNCESAQKMGMVLDKTRRKNCWWCRIEVPDDVQAIWMVHNFEAIQGAAYE